MEFFVYVPTVPLLKAPENPSFKSEVYNSMATIVEQRENKFEPAGKAYHAFQRRVSGMTWEKEKKKLEQPKESVTRTSTPGAASNDGGEDDSFPGGLRDDKNYYALLGISHVGLNASDKQIKRAYQEMILKTHPDKIRADASTEERAAANALFRDVQKAFEVLSDPEKRRGYDSQFDFDDWIPTGLETIRDDKSFFDLYAPVFEMNARFSTIKPVPLLGKSEDDEASVKAMYNFWRTFRSWRDFSAFDEFKDGDIETAEGRDHRRHMIKQNEVQREKRKKKEFARVQSLVERAFKNDPRLARFKAEAEKKKFDAKNAKENAKKAAEEAARAEAERAERELLEKQIANKERREAEKKAKNEAKQAKKKALKALFASIETLGVDEATFLKESDIFANVEPVEIHALASEIEVAKSSALFFEKCKALKSAQDASVKEEEEMKRQKSAELLAAQAKERADEKAKKALVWSTEALSFLAKGMAKFPGGTRNRWECVANFVGTSGFSASAEDCIEAAKKLAAAGPTKPTSFATGVPAEPAAPVQQTPAAPEASMFDSEPGDQNKNDKEWTADEQKLLEAGLREFPNTMEINERWAAIAAKVGSRNKKECAARVKELRAKAKQ